MTEKELLKLMADYSDAVITYKTTNSDKVKYSVCTCDFTPQYIAERKRRASPGIGQVLTFCWDTDSFKLITTGKILSVVPLSSLLRNEAHG